MNNNTIPLMAHLLAGYPDESGSFAVAEGLIAGGARYLEVQIPFSDPSADGPSILNATAHALATGWTVGKTFDFIQALHSCHPHIPIFLMSYVSVVFTPGIAAFVQKAHQCGVAGLIVPDLPFDCDEGLSEACEKMGIVSVPVVAPSMRNDRLETLIRKLWISMSDRECWIYAALRTGITGRETEIDDNTLAFLKMVGASGVKVLGGFGIRKNRQAKLLAPHVHAIVAGSVFIDALDEVLKENVGEHIKTRDTAIYNKMEDLCRELTLAQ